jgi:mannan endo-1,4-beta-mannosidase
VDPTRFRARARSLSQVSDRLPTRRSLLTVLGSGLLAAAGLPLPTTTAKRKKKKCRGGQVKCGGTCVDLQRDPTHCGSCDTTCDADQSCQNGRCQATPQGGTFTVSGRTIRDAAGNPVVFRGVNKMSVFDDEDPTGTVTFPEIRKTGANSVRIVWAITKDLSRNGPPTDPDVLDALITNAQANRLVPMIELHDATGDWSRLDDLVAYWTRPRIVEIITKHRAYLLVNIGNEVGDDTVTADQFATRYTRAVQSLRNAGIHLPLVIDAPDFGKNLPVLNSTAAALLAADPDHNLIFSVHLYYPIAGGADAQFIRTALEEAVALNYPLVVGEFSRFGAFNGNQSICTGGGETDYRTILQETQRHAIGWYAWEWGPGNGFFDPLCAIMDMTPDRLFANLKPGWAQEVATTSPHSIKNTAVSIL